MWTMLALHVCMAEDKAWLSSEQWATRNFKDMAAFEPWSDYVLDSTNRQPIEQMTYSLHELSRCFSEAWRITTLFRCFWLALQAVVIVDLGTGYPDLPIPIRQGPLYSSL